MSAVARHSGLHTGTVQSGTSTPIELSLMGYERRPVIAKPLQRAIRVEAGHRCAIPTCRQPVGLEIHHIKPWSRVKAHEFENLILLCSNCHARATKGEIDQQSMRAYKANLSLTTQRYGDLERRVLEYFVQNPEADMVEVDRSHELLLKYLIDDDILIKGTDAEGAIGFGELDPGTGSPQYILGGAQWRLTPAGKDFVGRLRSAKSVG